MGRRLTVTLREVEVEVEVISDGGYEYDTNARDLQWEFVNLSAEQHDALKLTSVEEDSIYNQLCDLIDSDTY